MQHNAIWTATINLSSSWKELGKRHEVFIWQNFDPAYQHLIRKNQHFRNEVSPPSHINNRSNILQRIYRGTLQNSRCFRNAQKSILSGRFGALTGRPGDLMKNLETPGKTGRVGRYAASPKPRKPDFRA